MENEKNKLPKGKIITAVVLILALAALGISYLLMKDRVPKAEESDDSSSYIEIFSAELSDISSVYVKTPKDEFTVSQKDGNFTISPENDELTREILSSYLESFTMIYATRRVSGGGKLAEYGINEEENYFEITLNDKTKRRFCIGDELNGDGYYCYLPEDDTAYIVPAYLGSHLLKAPQAQKADSDALSVTVDYENIYYVSLKKGDSTVFSAKRVSDSTALPYNFYSSYELTYPSVGVAYSTEFTNFLKLISATVTPIGQVGNAAENNAKYGIDSGYTLTVRDSAGNHTFRFGDRSELGAYMTYNDYPYVYVVPEDMLSVLESADPESFLTPYIDLYAVDDIDEIVIEAGKNSYTIKADNAKKKYSLNGKNLSVEEFNELYSGLTDIIVYTGVEQNLSKADEVCRISYKLKDGTKYERVYHSCGGEMVYMTTRESGENCTVKKSTVDSLLDKIKNLAK